jgi:elongation factor 2
MKFTVSRVVRIAVERAVASDLPKLVEGLTRLAIFRKSDPCVQVTHEETGEHIIIGAGELHLEICLKDLEEAFGNIPIKKSDRVVSFRETVTELSGIVCLSKSGNKLNRLNCQALPLDERLVGAIESNRTISDHEWMDGKIRGKELQTGFGWEQHDSRCVWSFVPD